MKGGGRELPPQREKRKRAHSKGCCSLTFSSLLAINSMALDAVSVARAIRRGTRTSTVACMEYGGNLCFVNVHVTCEKGDVDMRMY